jgi:putative addiction module component (TIGR02574 family)
MTPKALLDEILRLPPDQRLQLVEDVWDSLAASPDHVGVPAWHREELDRRLADPGEQTNLSWQDVQSRLRRRTP